MSVSDGTARGGRVALGQLIKVVGSTVTQGLSAQVLPHSNLLAERNSAKGVAGDYVVMTTETGGPCTTLSVVCTVIIDIFKSSNSASSSHSHVGA